MLKYYYKKFSEQLQFLVVYMEIAQKFNLRVIFCTLMPYEALCRV